MNKILSQAIRKAVSDYTPNVSQDSKDKRLALEAKNLLEYLKLRGIEI